MNYTKSIEAWAVARNLDTADPAHQLNKLMEELGELAEGFNKNRSAQVVDSLGDMYVVMTIFAQQNGLHIEQAIESAYNTIKDRKGKLVNGVFVKEQDLEEP
ncbi:MazG-like family protein [Lacticaseibacillus saniviri]